MFISPNPYAACKYLNLDTNAESFIYDVYKKAEKSDLPIYKQLLRLGKKMNYLDFGSEEEFQSIAYLVLGSSDSLFMDGLSRHDIDNGPFLDVHAIDKLCSLLFKPQDRKDEYQLKKQLDMVFAGVSHGYAASASNQVSVYSPYMKFKLWRGFLLNSVGKQQDDNSGDKKIVLTESQVEEFANKITHKAPIFQSITKDSKEHDWFDEVCISFMRELANTTNVLKYLPMRNTTGPMSALFIFMNKEMGINKPSILNAEHHLVQIRNKIAHGEMPWGQSYICNGVKALFIVSGAFGVIDKEHKLSWTQKLMNRLTFFIQNPITGISVLLLSLFTLCFAIIGLFAIGHIIWMAMGTPAFDRIDTDGMGYEEKAEFYEVAARGDTTALKDFQFKYKWLRDHNLKQADR